MSSHTSPFGSKQGQHNTLIHLSSADLFLQFRMGGGNDQTLDRLVKRDSENICEQTILQA